MARPTLPDIMIRTASADDVTPVVDVLNAVLPAEDRVSLEEFRYGETMRDPHDVFNRLVAVAASRSVAVAETGNHVQGRPAHMFRLIIAVQPAFQRRGIGSELERRQRTFAIQHGGTELTAMIRRTTARRGRSWSAWGTGRPTSGSRWSSTSPTSIGAGSPTGTAAWEICGCGRSRSSA